MRFILAFIIGLGIAAGVYYLAFSSGAGMQTETQNSANSAKDAADAYQKNQQEMMQQLQ